MTTALEKLYGDILGSLTEWPGPLMGDADCKLCGRPTIRGRHLGQHEATCPIARRLAQPGANGLISHEDVVDALATDEQRERWAFGAQVEALDATLRRKGLIT